MPVASEPPRGWDASPCVSRAPPTFDLVHRPRPRLAPPPSIGSRWRASARDRRRTRSSAAATAAAAAAAAPEEAAVRTWAFLFGLAIFQWLSGNRADAVVTGERARRSLWRGNGLGHLGVATCRLSLSRVTSPVRYLPVRQSFERDHGARFLRPGAGVQEVLPRGDSTSRYIRMTAANSCLA